MVGKFILVIAGAASAFAVGTHLATATANTPELAAHEDGNAGMFSLDLTPREGSREVDVLLVNEHAKRAWVALAIEVVDERGATVMPARRLEPVAVDAHAAAPELEHALPSKLADGYYTVRVTGAVADGEVAETRTAWQHLHVEGGRSRWVSASELYTESAAIMATPIAAVPR